MEFTIPVFRPDPDLDRIGEVLRSVDPAAVVDLHDGRLRVAGAFDLPSLVAALGAAGHEVALDQVSQLPSVCCGSCSG
ncbi:hypothetical protein [Marilutibacter alkalisoli]|uniref:Heavy-metal-associated domain-containing protein n=1 Tax=Marilutibacter alkalisoli TaxID=2591633 RepID=A0A514BQF9_9GAMM|nr:hypothetical protein [Lysobacter alkalisoli]QDH69638.1 hypothetical protein FKV23_05690 [Lysobacter alkalisoli]